jgi:hypothetical protein
MIKKIPVLNSRFRVIGYTIIIMLFSLCLAVCFNMNIIDDSKYDNSIFIPSGYIFHGSSIVTNSIFSAFITLIFPILIYALYMYRNNGIYNKYIARTILAGLILITTVYARIMPTLSFILTVFMIIVPIIYCDYMGYKSLNDPKVKNRYIKNSKRIFVGYFVTEILIYVLFHILIGINPENSNSYGEIIEGSRIEILSAEADGSSRFIHLSQEAEIIMYAMLAIIFILLVYCSIRNLAYKKYGIINLAIAAYFIIKTVIAAIYSITNLSAFYCLFPFQYNDFVVDIFLFGILLYFAIYKNSIIDTNRDWISLCDSEKYFKGIEREYGRYSGRLPYIASRDVEAERIYSEGDKYSLKKSLTKTIDGKEYILFKVYDFYGYKTYLILTKETLPGEGLCAYAVVRDALIVSSMLREYRSKIDEEKI